MACTEPQAPCPEANPEAVGVEATAAEEERSASFDEPIHLLRPSEDHCSLVANVPAMQRLQSLGPVAVLSVVGNQRGGKSTLMNLLHSRRLTGFQTGHYMDPQTHGLWVWPKPHPRRPGLTVLLVDSEGLDSPHVPQHYNWLISAVTLLMSDVYMYQTKGSIEQSSAERLDMILKVAEQLGKAGGSQGGQQVQAGAAFLWLLRDHQLQMKGTPKQELMEKLDPSQVRALSRSFGDFDCVPLPRPAADSVLREMDKHGWHNLDGDFKEEFVVLERRLLELLGRPRQMLDQDLTGAALAEVLRQYLDAIAQRKGSLADICEMPTQRQMLQQLAGRRAMEAGVRRYEEGLAEQGLRGPGSRLPVRPRELLEGHRSAAEAAEAALEAEARSAGLERDEVQGFLEQLRAKLESWAAQPRLAVLGGLGGSEEDAGFEAESMLEVASSQRQVPKLSKSPVLEGGLLLDLWKENARRALPAQQRWQQRSAGLCDSALQAVRGDAQLKASAALQGFQGELRGVLAEAQGEEAGGLGPWAPLADGGEPQRALLAAVEQGDRLVLALAEEGLRAQGTALQERLAEQRRELSAGAEAAERELRAGLEAAGAEIARLSAALTAAEERSQQLLATVKEARRQAIEKAAALQEEGLSNLREEVREALKNLKAVMSREVQDRLAAQERASSEALARAAEAASAAEARAREACSSVKEQLESHVVRAREDTSELRRTLEAAEARLAESQRAAEAAQREQLQHGLQAADARAESRAAELQASLERLRGGDAGLEALRKSVEELAVSRQEQAAAVEGLEAGLRAARQGEADLATRLDDLAKRDLPVRLEELAASARTQASQLQQALQASESRCLLELENAKPRLEARCKDQAEKLLAERLPAALREAEAEEAKRAEKRLVPVLARLGALDRSTEEASEEIRRQADVMKQHDFQTLWESLAHLASRLTDIQEVVDNLSLKGAGLTGALS